MDTEIFQKQIDFKPEVVGGVNFEYDNVVVCGMGGSGFPARILFFLEPTFPLWLHQDYGMPEKTEGKTLFIAISYSGNTGETLSFTEEVMRKGLPLAIVASGGALLDRAKEENLPYVLVPGGMAPRDGIIYMLKALLKILGKGAILEEIGRVNLGNIKPTVIPLECKDHTTLVYSSRENATLGYLWKIMLNETAKTLAFNNIFPELTHNEMQSVFALSSKKNKELIIAVLYDEEDSSKTKRMMEVFRETAKECRIRTAPINLPKGKVNKLFSTIVLARGNAYMLAEAKSVSPGEVTVIDSFKQKLK